MKNTESQTTIKIVLTNEDHQTIVEFIKPEKVKDLVDNESFFRALMAVHNSDK